MATGKRLGKFLKYIAVLVLVLAAAAVAIALLALNNRGPIPTAADPSIEAKATHYSQEVAAQMEAESKAAAEALLIRLKFPADRPLRVLFAGDTITGGYFASTQTKGFSQLISASLASHGDVEEVRGPNTGGKVDTLGGLESIPSGLELAILQLGTIEVGERDDVAKFSDEYATMLRNLKARSPTAAIICLSAWQSSEINVGAYDRVIREQCRIVGGQFVDVRPVFADLRNRGPEGVKTWAGVSDEFHPNDAGHQAIADKVLARIKLS